MSDKLIRMDELALHPKAQSKSTIQKKMHNINKLIRSLEKSNQKKANAEDPALLQDYVNDLITKCQDDQYDLSKDLSSIVEHYNHNAFDPEQFANMVELEQKRTQHILKMASSLNGHISKLYASFGQMIDKIEALVILPIGMRSAVNSRIDVVKGSLDGMTRVICAPDKDFDAVVDKIEHDAATAELNARTQETAYNNQPDQEIKLKPDVLSKHLNLDLNDSMELLMKMNTGRSNVNTFRGAGSPRASKATMVDACVITDDVVIYEVRDRADMDCQTDEEVTYDTIIDEYDMSEPAEEVENEEMDEEKNKDEFMMNSARLQVPTTPVTPS